MNESFEDLPWHDTWVTEIVIDRKSPGHNDCITMAVVWPDETKAEVEFYECRAFEAKMNFGIIANESVMDARINQNNEGLSTVKESWAKVGVALPKLKCYEFEMSSTGSVLWIYAEGFRLNRQC